MAKLFVVSGVTSGGYLYNLRTIQEIMDKNLCKVTYRIDDTFTFRGACESLTLDGEKLSIHSVGGHNLSMVLDEGMYDCITIG